MPWYALHSSSGRLESQGTAKPDTVPPGLTVKEFAAAPDLDAQLWDEATKTYAARLARAKADRVADFRNDPSLSTAWGRLTAAQQTAVQNYIATMLGPYRYREFGEEVAIQGGV